MRLDFIIPTRGLIGFQSEFRKVWASCTAAERAWMMLGLAVYAIGSLSARYPQERLHYLGYGILAGLLHVGFARRSPSSVGATPVSRAPRRLACSGLYLRRGPRDACTVASP